MFGLCIRPAVAMVAVLASLAAEEPARALRNVKVGDQVPAFSVTDLDGNTITKEAYQEKTLLLVFVRPDQEKSLAALKTAERMFKEYGDSNLAALAVLAKPQAADQFKQIAAENKFTYPLAVDPERKMYGDFGLLVAPTTLLIDKSGVLRYEAAHIPPNHEERLRIHVQEVLGKINAEQRDAMLARMTEGKPAEMDASNRRLGLARTLMDRRRFDQAVPILVKLRAEQDSPEAAALLGTAYLALDKVDEAAKCLDPLADLKPALPEVKLALARLEVRRQAPDKAEAHLREALEAAPDDGPILFELGRLYEQRGETGQALECYRKALEQVYGTNR